MPTNLKSLLSRSRSRNDLKQAQQGNGSKSSNSNDKDKGQEQGTQSQSSPTSPEDEPSSFQIHDFNIGSSSILGKQSSSNSHSLFSLPGSSAPSSSSSPNHTALQSKSHPVTPQHNFTNTNSPARSSMRKCETVLALTSTPTATTTSSKICKGMKDRILSTSSSALNSILHSSSKTTTKLFSGFKLGSSSGNHSSQINNPCPGTATTMQHQTNGGTTGSHNSLVVCNCNCNCQPPPLTPMNRLRRNGSLKSHLHSSNMNMTMTRTSSVTSVQSDDDEGGFAYGGGFEAGSGRPEELIQCRLCLSSIKWRETLQIEACSCRYCKDCVEAYVTFEIGEGATDIACPDATCEKQGVLSLSEISTIVSSQLLEKHHKFRLYKEVETNSQLMWCPSPGCDTICTIYESATNGSDPKIPTIQCTRCQHVWCTQCKLPIHPNQSCDYYRQKLINSGKLSIIDEEPFAAYDSIKKCPFCHVPIEKDSGCAQMMCKRCKHVFCWYCLTSLDDDFLLRHYDKGPCKNKLGHSRASVVWHRTQVIGIFAGFGLLVLLASPLLILAAPCLLCCRCRYCTDHLDSSSTDDNPELL